MKIFDTFTLQKLKIELFIYNNQFKTIFIDKNTKFYNFQLTNTKTIILFHDFKISTLLLHKRQEYLYPMCFYSYQLNHSYATSKSNTSFTTANDTRGIKQRKDSHRRPKMEHIYWIESRSHNARTDENANKCTDTTREAIWAPNESISNTYTYMHTICLRPWGEFSCVHLIHYS